MRKRAHLRLLAGLVAAAASGACYHTGTAAGVVYVTDEPPLSPVEVIPTSPGFNYVWVGGHWGWSSNRYLWVPGSWVVPSRGYSVWVPGRWDRDHHGWYWTSGHWR